jgi:hypothetical protein
MCCTPRAEVLMFRTLLWAVPDDGADVNKALGDKYAAGHTKYSSSEGLGSKPQQ